jgi:hypothetical protein
MTSDTCNRIAVKLHNPKLNPQLTATLEILYCNSLICGPGDLWLASSSRNYANRTITSLSLFSNLHRNDGKSYRWIFCQNVESSAVNCGDLVHSDLL